MGEKRPFQGFLDFATRVLASNLGGFPASKGVKKGQNRGFRGVKKLEPISGGVPKNPGTNCEGGPARTQDFALFAYPEMYKNVHFLCIPFYTLFITLIVEYFCGRGVIIGSRKSDNWIQKNGSKWGLAKVPFLGSCFRTYGLHSLKIKSVFQSSEPLNKSLTIVSKFCPFFFLHFTFDFFFFFYCAISQNKKLNKRDEGCG